MNKGDAETRGAAEAGRPGRTAFDWPHDTGTIAAVLHEMEVQVSLRRRRWRRLQASAGAATVLLACVWLWRPAAAPEPAAPAADALVSAPVRRILPDGSVAVLRGDAAVEVDYTQNSRRVRLLRGEAIFDVRKDAARPFVVRATRIEVRAVGTEFAVSVQDGAVEVLVTEGEVAVQDSDAESTPADNALQPPSKHRPGLAAAPPRSRRGEGAALPAEAVTATSSSPLFEYKVPAGKRIVVPLSPQAPAPEVVAISPEEITQRLGWRVPTLRFSRTPLRKAVAMINEHSRVRLVLEGTALDALPLSGAIRADNIEALLDLLAADYGIVAEPRGGTEIALRAAP